MWLTAFNMLLLGRVPGSIFLSNQTQSPLFSTMETPKLKNRRTTQRACWSRYMSCLCWVKIHHCVSFCHLSSRELLSEFLASPTKPPSESGMSWFQLPFSGWIMYRDLTIGANSTEEKKGQPSIILLINPSLHAFLSRSIAVSLSSICLFSSRRIMIIIVCFGTLMSLCLPPFSPLYPMCSAWKYILESLWSSFLSPSLFSRKRDILSCVLRLCLPFVFLWNSNMHQTGHWQGVWW